MNYKIETKEEYDAFLELDEIPADLMKEVVKFGYLYKYGHNYAYLDIEIGSDKWSITTNGRSIDTPIFDGSSLSPMDRAIISMKANAIICGVNMMVVAPMVLIAVFFIWLVWK